MIDVLEQVPQDTVMTQTSTPCLQRLSARSWERTLALRVGRLVCGVRVNSPRAASLVDRRLEPVRVPQLDGEVNPNFSVELSDDGGARQRGLHLVYHDHEIVARRREEREVLTDLVELLDDTVRPYVTRRPVVHASALLTPDGASVLFPARMYKGLLTRRGQLQAAGLELLRTRVQQVDVASASLVLGFEDPMIAPLIDGESGRTVSGSYPLRVWCLPAFGNEPFDFRSVEAVFAGFSMVLNRHTRGPGAVLRDLSDLVQRVRVVGLPEASPATLANTLVDFCR